MYYEDSLEPEAPDAPARPAEVPEEFWDDAAGAIRTEALLRSYLDLERRTSGMVRLPAEDSPPEELAAFHRALGVPETPDGYAITAPHQLLASDGEVNRRLHAAGFTPAQAQLVYDLAHDRVLPMLAEMAAEAERRLHLDRLRDHFGGDARWAETARQLAAWGKANLPDQAYRALSATADGVKAMQRMMASGEPGLGQAAAPEADALDEAGLKKLMRDPRYWKTRDPAFIDKVTAGFRRLHGEG